MRNFIILRLINFLITGILLSAAAVAADGEIIHIVSHDRVKVVTDPSRGYNPYRSWALFPSTEIEFRKVILHIRYQCPDSLHCGEWDYIDNIFIRRRGSQDADTGKIEIARMISPYGWRFGPDWRFDWQTDITDFGFLLHDSVEIEFNHTGYEKNDDRGWVVTLDFEMTAGPPAMKCLGFDTLWCGSFPYGDSARPIENFLSPFSLVNNYDAALARVRILQTGHGMDEQENCAEFCRKYRRLYIGDSLIDERFIWRECGDNPLYPQAGTWIFDRAGWCPGAVVHPDIYDYPILGDTLIRVNIDMEPYLNPKNPTANFHIYSYLFYYTPPTARYDITLEDLIAPSVRDEYSRRNPVCANPRIIVRNNGSEKITSFAVTYGFIGEETSVYNWSGNLMPQKSVEITLAGDILPRQGKSDYLIRLDMPNGQTDEYLPDNSAIAAAKAVPLLGTDLILNFRANQDSSHNFYRLSDESGALVAERKLGTLNSARSYYDTLHLTPGCYYLLFGDTAGDGLDFWFNPEGGYGFVRLLDIQGRLLKSFLSDFGSEINFSFQVQENPPPMPPEDTLPLVTPFPARNSGKFNLDIFFNEKSDFRLEIWNEDSSKIVFRCDYKAVKEAFLPLDISSEPEGIYFVKVLTESNTIVRRVRLKRT